MSRYQSIEKALISINDAVFQELCDKFLILKNRNYRAFSRVGSQVGKQKTIKGTPDSFFLLQNDNYLFIESTTNISNKEKLAQDIKDCFDYEKTKVPIDKIEEIILCFNFEIGLEKIEELNVLAANFKDGIIVNYWSLERLAIELQLQHKNLVSEYLDIPLDTGQVVSIEQFIAAYDKKAAKGISTPLSNTFLHREEDKKEVKQAIHDSDFVILTGAPGVGKTKLAIETISEFLSENEDYSAYCISYKQYDLLDDLYQYLDDVHNYILFVDDANRIDAFGQITGFYENSRKNKLKVVITVREYAYSIVYNICHDYNPKSIKVEKFTDKQLIDIIKANPFKILNPDYHDVIINIADGNPRLAIMTSLLAIKEQKLSALSDLTHLFEKYYTTFVVDKSEFGDNFNIKCLGLIAFFNALPYKNKDILGSILKDFKIDYDEFIDALDLLDKLELVELQYDYVKIPEQNLANYFFYKSFIKDELLSFRTLLKNYFDKNTDRFTDCIIPVNNTFGHLKVLNKLKPKLKHYWELINSDKNKAYNFLSVFWFYLEIETLEFVQNAIKCIPEIKIDDYNSYIEITVDSNNKNPIIDLLSKFFIFRDNLKNSLELSFAFVQKQPDYLSELINSITENLIFDHSDERDDFYRQTLLFEVLTDGLSTNNNLYTASFYKLLKTFLKHIFHHTKGGRNNTFYWYNYPLPNSSNIRKLRADIWNTVNNHFDKNQTLSMELLKSLVDVSPDVVKEIMEYDIPFIVNIIHDHLSPEIFEHCKYVQEQNRWAKRNEVSNPKLEELSRIFTNPMYEMYLKIDWDRLRDKEQWEFTDFGEYEKLKEIELKSAYTFKNENDINSFFKTYKYLRNKITSNWSSNRALDIIINENLNNNFKVGVQLIRCVIQNDNKIDLLPITTFRNHLNTQEKINKIWELINEATFQNKNNWELLFFENISDSSINEKIINEILKTINTITVATIFHIDYYIRYLKYDKLFFQKILQAILNRNNDIGNIIQIWLDPFDQHFDKLGNNLLLIKQSYLQQELINNTFDHKGDGFLNILRKDKHFIVEFVQYLYSQDDMRLSGSHKQLGFVWKIDNIDKHITQVFDVIIKNEPYFGILADFGNTFFRNLTDDTAVKADNFLFDYVNNNFNDPRKMNIVVDIIRRTRKELFEDILLLYISLNQNIDDFSRIYWRGNGGSYVGDVIIGDIEANEWRNILSIVTKSDLAIELILIKKYLNDRIEGCLNQSRWEKLNRFLGND